MLEDGYNTIVELEYGIMIFTVIEKLIAANTTDLITSFANSEIIIYIDIHSMLYFGGVKIDNVNNIIIFDQYGDNILVKELLKKIKANASETMFLGVANNFGSVMLKDKVKVNRGWDVFAGSSPGEVAPAPTLDECFEIKNNNIACMGCMGFYDN